MYPQRNIHDYTSVKHEFHIARARSLGSSGGNMLTDIAGRDNDLSLADVVVFHENNLKQITNLLIVVDDLADLVDQVNNRLGHPVPRRSLASEDANSGLHLLPLLWLHVLELEIAMDDAEDIELLSLVLVDTLDLDVEQAGWVDRDAVGFLDVLRKPDFVRVLDLLELLAEFFVVNECLQLVEQREVFQEVVTAEFAGDELGETRIGLVQPSPWCDAVRYVCELVWTVDFDEIFENGGLDQIGVKLGHTVHLVAANNSQVSHAHHLRLAFFNDRDTSKHITVFRKLSLDVLQEVQINIIDDRLESQHSPYVCS